MRIAIGGIATESSTFSPDVTRLEDFRVLREEALLAAGRYPFLSKFDSTIGTKTSEVLKTSEVFSEIEFLPTLQASALPGAPVDRGAYEALKGEFLGRLRGLLPLDGVYLDLHGAMNVRGMDDAEGDWAVATREVVGADCLIGASMDLHGNISERFVAAIDMLAAYRTAPHVDYMVTREKAVGMLVRCLREGIRPFITRLPVPVILPGERTSTEWEPGTSVYAALAETDKQPGILDASIFVGYVWADEPRASATIIVTGTDEAVNKREAARLGQIYWEGRHDFNFGVPTGSIDDCIEMALAAEEACVFISDSGDNPTAGGVGDVPAFLERLLAHEVPSAVVASIVDATAVAQCHAAGLNNTVTVSLGGKLDAVHGRPLTVTGRVIFLKEQAEVGGDLAVLQSGGVKVIVTQRRKPFHYIAEFEKLGIDPLAHKIVVVKIGYLVPDLKRAAPKALLALSPGAVNQDIVNLRYERIKRPMFPLDAEMEWKA
ncbi:MAG: M81 family metallopeptidase [Ardenticatenaceae bacterium]|nr:M81 family metallopeptidase [Ardenticatenaceae bacterium]